LAKGGLELELAKLYWLFSCWRPSRCILWGMGKHIAQGASNSRRRIITALTVIATTLGSLLFVLGVFALLLNRWVFRTWSSLTFDQLMFTLRAPAEGTNPDIISDGIRAIAPGTALAIALALLLVLLLRRNRQCLLLVTAAFTCVGLVTAIGAGANADERLDIVYHVAAQQVDSDFIRDNYVDPARVTLQFPEQKRNLIYIFLESAEVTFADTSLGGALSPSVMPELEQLALEHEDFSGGAETLNGATVLPGTSWTMGGMFGQTAGLPLLTPIGGNAMSTQEEFFPNITPLGALLDGEGYSNNLLIGSLAGFGGRDLYFSQHGNYNIWDYDYALSTGLIPEGHFVWWGFEDWRLFEIAKERATELAAGDQPFNLTLLTVDTHAEEGWLDPSCPTGAANQMSDVWLCSSAMVADFIAWVQEQPFYENTTIVLSGDHHTMADAFPGGLWAVDENAYDRLTYVNVINAANAASSPELHREYATIDLFPTTVAALGVEIPGNRLALGTNLFSDQPTLIEEYGLAKVRAEFNRSSSFMEELAGPIILPTSALPGTNFPLMEEGLFSPNEQCRLVPQQNGSIEITQLEGPPYHSSTGGLGLGVEFEFTKTGNLELRLNGDLLAQSNTANRGALLELRDDCNLVIVDDLGTDIWALWGVPDSSPIFDTEWVERSIA